MKILVTVGSTQFAELTGRFERSIDWLLQAIPDLTQLTIQHGSAPFTPPPSIPVTVKLVAFPYTSSMDQLIAEADMVISHAGSGSILECLRPAYSSSPSPSTDCSPACQPVKRLVVVVNERLMDNHQWELATELHSRRHLLATNCAALEDAIERAVKFTFLPLPSPDRQAFRRVLVRQISDLQRRNYR